MTHVITQGSVDRVLEILYDYETADEASFRANYSGRGMYGKSCVGFVVGSHAVLSVGAALAEALREDYPDTLEHMIKKAALDGHGTRRHRLLSRRRAGERGQLMNDMRRRAAHYKGLAEGAKRMQQMGHRTASGGGGGMPPKKTCRLLALALLAAAGASALLPAASLVRWLIS